MRKGYSIVITTTDSGNTRYFFVSKKLLKITLLIITLLLIAVVINAVGYSKIYYQALESAILKRRNIEIEREFTKIEEIKKNLKIAEMHDQKLRIMLGIDQTPGEVKPVINEVNSDYSKKIDTVIVDKRENIPSLLPVRGRISRNFSPEHQGIDIATPRFSPVIAAASGKIEATGWDSVYGNYVTIEHDINYSTFYGHLNSIDVQKGNKVTGGVVIGTIGSTGKSTSPHLHYEVRFQGKPVDPIGYLPLYLNFKE